MSLIVTGGAGVLFGVAAATLAVLAAATANGCALAFAVPRAATGLAFDSLATGRAVRKVCLQALFEPKSHTAATQVLIGFALGGIHTKPSL